MKKPSYSHPDTFSTLALQQSHLKRSKNIHPLDGKLLYIWHWELSSVLCDDLKGWHGGEGGRLTRERMFVYIQLIHTVAQQKLIILQSNYTPVLILIFLKLKLYIPTIYAP